MVNYLCKRYRKSLTLLVALWSAGVMVSQKIANLSSRKVVRVQVAGAPLFYGDVVQWQNG